MCGPVTSDIFKTFSKTLPDTKNCKGNVTGLLERSPKADGFFKSVSGSTPSFSGQKPVDGTAVSLVKNSEYSSFFGVGSAENIQECLHNQLALATIKMEEQNITSIFRMLLDESSPYSGEEKLLQKSLNDFFDTGAGRITMTGKVFGDEDATHTIGFVYDKKNGIVYVLDSLPKEFQELYREQIEKMFTDNTENPVSLVYSSKSQQNTDEYTCNNWTHANIEAVRGIAESGKVLNEEELNAALPNDINEILKSQYEYLTNERKLEYSDFIKDWVF